MIYDTCMIWGHEYDLAWVLGPHGFPQLVVGTRTMVSELNADQGSPFQSSLDSHIKGSPRGQLPPTTKSAINHLCQECACMCTCQLKCQWISCKTNGIAAAGTPLIQSTKSTSNLHQIHQSANADGSGAIKQGHGVPQVWENSD